jgi:hypothetical protein
VEINVNELAHNYNNRQLRNTNENGNNLCQFKINIRGGAEVGDFYLHRVQTDQPPIQCVPGALSLGVKRRGRGADHLPPSSAEGKNAWSHTSIPQHVFMAWCSVKAQGQLYLGGLHQVYNVYTFMYYMIKVKM